MLDIEGLSYGYQDQPAAEQKCNLILFGRQQHQKMLSAPWVDHFFQRVLVANIFIQSKFSFPVTKGRELRVVVHFFCNRQKEKLEKRKPAAKVKLGEELSKSGINWPELKILGNICLRETFITFYSNDIKQFFGGTLF